MTLDQYKRFYIEYVVTILGPAVKREAQIDIALQRDANHQAFYENLKNGLVILSLVSFIESNFLNKSQLKALRKFKPCTSALPQNIDPTHLSCFIYLRDCFAHNPTAQLLPQGDNTSGFLSALSSGRFPWASASGPDIRVGEPHELHLIVLRFFGEAV